MTDRFEAEKTHRGLWHRAKFVGPMICALISSAIAVFGLLLVRISPAELSGDLSSIVTMTVTALLGLGGAIAGAAGFHDGMSARNKSSDQL